MSAIFATHGAIIVDGDVIAREVVEPGTGGLARLVEAFGAEILLPDGALNRPALAAVAFSDDEKRATLNGIVHPLVGQRRAEIIAAASTSGEVVIVEDIPLLVESQMAPLFPLVLVVHADVETRVTRLTELRGMPEADARARIAAQASEEQRRVVADVWLENSGDQQVLKDLAEQLWEHRILPFAQNLQRGTPVPAPVESVPFDPSWADQAGRIVARLQTACGHRARSVEHVGPTAVPGTDTPDVIDIKVTVDAQSVDELPGALRGVGYLPVGGTGDYASADPGRPTNVYVRT